MIIRKTFLHYFELLLFDTNVFLKIFLDKLNRRAGVDAVLLRLFINAVSYFSYCYPTPNIPSLYAASVCVIICVSYDITGSIYVTVSSISDNG